MNRDGHMTRLTFSLDVSRCSGCMACVVACMDQNDPPEGILGFKSVERIEMGAYPHVRISFVSISCFNCENPPCIMVCPTGAIRRSGNNGIVQTVTDLCIGCHACLMACPFGSPVFGGAGTMTKCNSCEERVDQGLEPACVRVCPTRALRFGPAARAALETPGETG